MTTIYDEGVPTTAKKSRGSKTPSTPAERRVFGELANGTVKKLAAIDEIEGPAGGKIKPRQRPLQDLHQQILAYDDIPVIQDDIPPY